uniref:Uncharacterized protein n=1 Tax=Anopheles epiroticus TaxID=199890 RepID=A0A182PFB5_9DIPT
MFNQPLAGYLGSFLSNSLKTHQLEVNTDSKTLRPIARLKEPRELFALPKERDYDCPQQAPRWPIECQLTRFVTSPGFVHQSDPNGSTQVYSRTEIPSSILHFTFPQTPTPANPVGGELPDEAISETNAPTSN